MSEKAELKLDGQSVELPIVTGSENEKAIDIRNFRGETGYITLDSGYKNTGATESGITFLDGEKGILRYRGYPIEQLAENSTFLEVAYLLINGELPSKTQYDEFTTKITRHTLIHEDMKQFYEAYPSKAHPMAVFGIYALHSLYLLSTVSGYRARRRCYRPYDYKVDREDLNYSSLVSQKLCRSSCGLSSKQTELY